MHICQEDIDSLKYDILQISEVECDDIDYQQKQDNLNE